MLYFWPSLIVNSESFRDKLDDFQDVQCGFKSEKKKKNIQQLGGLFWSGGKNQEVILLGYMKKLCFFPPKIFNCKRRDSWNLKTKEAPSTFVLDL